jgi:hypothetical protein
VHTHPSSASPWPSAHDVSEARRLGVHLLVVANDAVTVATPAGQTHKLLGRQWLTSAAKTPALASGTGRDPRGRRSSLRR